MIRVTRFSALIVLILFSTAGFLQLLREFLADASVDLELLLCTTLFVAAFVGFYIDSRKSRVLASLSYGLILVLWLRLIMERGLAEYSYSIILLGIVLLHVVVIVYKNFTILMKLIATTSKRLRQRAEKSVLTRLTLGALVGLVLGTIYFAFSGVGVEVFFLFAWFGAVFIAPLFER